MGKKCLLRYKKQGETYTRQELEEALYDVMRVATDNKYAEPIAWHGSGNSWLPEIDENGSVSIEGGIEVKIDKDDLHSKDKKLSFEKEGIELSATNYRILKVNSSIHKRESGFEIEGGLYEKRVLVKFKEEIFKQYDKNESEERFQKRKAELEKSIELTLLGTKKTMELIQKGDILVMPNRKKFESIKPFALLLKDTEKNIYYRLGLVELGEGNEKLKENARTTIINDNLQESNQQPQMIQTNLPNFNKYFLNSLS